MVRIFISLAVCITCVLAACYHKQSKQKTMLDSQSCDERVDVENWKREILHIDSVMINGQIPVIADTAQIFNILGNPKRIFEKSPDEDFLPYLVEYPSMYKAFIYYYGRTSFDVIADQAILGIVDFRDTDVILVHPRITLKKGLDVREVIKLFPESGKLVLESGNAWSGHIELRTTDKGLDPRRWFLVFQAEKLQKVILGTFSRK